MLDCLLYFPPRLPPPIPCLISVRKDVKGLAKLLRSFVDANGDTSKSPNYANPALDEPLALLELWHEPKLQMYEELIILLVWTLKILSRKEQNRLAYGLPMLRAVMNVLSTTHNALLARECCNTVLNLCYEKDNVKALLDMDGLPVLLTLLDQLDDVELVGSVMGALQSVCFQPIGRMRLFELDGTHRVVPLLRFASQKVTARAVGVVNNLSSYPQTIRIIRELEGIPPIIVMLRSPDASVVLAAAGAIQNMAREVKSRQLILAGDAVAPLTDILFGDDVQAQATAAGALLNLLGPELSDLDNGIDDAHSDVSGDGVEDGLPMPTPAAIASVLTSRAQFKRTLSDCLVLGVLFNSVYPKGK